MKTQAFWVWMWRGVLMMAGLPGLRADWAADRAAAERWFAEGSYARAAAVYAAAPTNLPPDEARWVAFRAPDTRWRAESGNLRTEAVESALRDLDRAFPGDLPEAERDAVWAGAQESMGDLHRRRGDPWDWTQTRLMAALDWWAGQSDLDRARVRYLDIVWKLAEPAGRRRGYRQDLPLEILNNAVAVARDPVDIARARHLRALALSHFGPPDERALYLVEDDFEAALAAGRDTDWHDDALFALAQWLERSGRLVLQEDSWMRGPDPARALERYEELVRTHAEGESRHWRNARDRAAEIRRESVGVAVPGTFLPDSEVQFHLQWRNVGTLRYAIHPIDLPAGILRADPRQSLDAWVADHPDPVSGPVATGIVDGADGGLRLAMDRPVTLTNRLQPGAYLVEVRGGSQRARELLLVTDAAVTLRLAGRTTLAWVTDATTGRPVPDARVVLVHRRPAGNGTFTLETRRATSGADGVVRFDLDGRDGELLVAAESGGRTALARSWVAGWGEPGEEWKLYVYTDRPAVRPGETLSWKLTARRRAGGVDRTPAGAELHYEITDPRGAAVTNGTVRLNDFGSAWGELVPGPDAPLGMYSIRFDGRAGRGDPLGSSPLFRLEEYRLPEFEVAVETATEAGPDGAVRPRAFKLGETVEATIRADYYFGGPVADAEVEVVVRQADWHPGWPEPMPYPWMRAGGVGEMAGRMPGWSSRSMEVRRETLRTDAGGRAVLRLPTEAAGGDVEFRIEARVTDASRREVAGTSTVRVTRQRYFVRVQPGRRVPRPGERVPVEVRGQDANGNPVSVEGRVRVTREAWREVWWDPQGREVGGEALERLRSPGNVWPPPPDAGGAPWRLKSRGYEAEEVRMETLRLGTNGLARWEFTPEKDGFYRIAWSSPGNATAPPPPDARPRPFEPAVTAEGTVWAGGPGTRELGYRADGVELLVDAAAVSVGRTLPVMVAVDGPGRWVLFTTDLDGAISHQVLEFSGRARLVEIPVGPEHVPNFWLGAVMVRDRQVLGDEENVQVPPESRFLSVEVTPDRAVHEPRDEARLRVVTRDHAGNPVAAEVGLALVDDSVFAIQPELAPDPREFFFGGQRPSRTRIDGSFNRQPYLKLVRDARGGIRDERDLAGPMEMEGIEADAFAMPVLAARYGLVAGRGGAKVNVLARRGRSLAMGDGLAMEAMAAPMPAAMAVADRAMGGEEAGAEPVVVVRSDFRSTAFWRPDVVTGADGTAEVTVRLPESLTRWRATARAVTREGSVGKGRAETRTRQPLMVRLQTPRFLVVGDEAWLGALVDNHTAGSLSVDVVPEVDGADVTGHRVEDSEQSGAAARVTVPPGGTVRVEWRVRPAAAGSLRFRVTGRAGGHADAMERVLPIEDHGLEKLVAVSAEASAGDAEAVLVLPEERRPGTTRFAVRVTPSRAVALLDALPYLADYPYGCTEQTLSRFLPAVVVRRTLRDLGLDPEAVMAGAFGGIGPAPTGVTHPGGRRDLLKLDDMVAAGLGRLRDLRRPDGSWGWWAGGEADAWMTAYVVWGLAEARAAGIDTDPLDHGTSADWLRARLAEFEDQPDQQAWMLHALAVHGDGRGGVGGTPEEAQAFARCFERRDDLNPMTRALLTLAAHRSGRVEEARVLARNLENGIRRGDLVSSAIAPGAGRTPDAASTVTHWGETVGWRRWSHGAVESTAFTLRALLAVDPAHPLVGSTVRWMLGNRRAARWNNTRDTALAILALNDHLRVSGEAVADLEYAVEVNGREVGRRRVSGRDPATFASEWSVPEDRITATNRVRIRRLGGTSPIYLTASAEFFSTEEPVAAAGNGLFVRRDYFRLVPRPTLLKGVVEDRVAIPDGAVVSSGDRVEVVVTVESPHDLEYLMLEDLKPAGLEAVEARSGGWLMARALRPAVAGRATGDRPTTDFAGGSRGVYPEWRDRKAALFIDRLPAGIWEIRYAMRAEVPGQFHALPVVAGAMYVPDIRANGAEVRLGVGERRGE